MIDWHSHILPEMDDGSRDVGESVSLLEMQRKQGVDTVIATPHFYADEESVTSFLERRGEALERLKPQLPPDAPAIRLGAEVYYYAGISRLENLKALRIEGTELLLLEMPMTAWTEFMVKELAELSAKSGIVVVLAHVERYLSLQKKSLWKELARNGVQMQVNANAFSSFSRRRKAMTLMKNGLVRFVGSDCHNVATRPPNIGNAFEIIEKRFGNDFISQLNEYGSSLLVKNN